MQTSITETLDFGIPGEFASTNPRHVDPPYTVAADVTLGKVIALKDNQVAPVGTSGYTAKKGIAVSPHQKVGYGTSGNALAPTMTVKAGDTVAVITMGDVYVDVAVSATVNAITGYSTEAAAVAAAKTALDAALIDLRGDTLYFDSTGTITTTVNSGNAIGTVRDCGAARDVAYTVVAAKSGDTWGVANPSATANVVAALAIDVNL